MGAAMSLLKYRLLLPSARAPRYSTPSAAGLDLYACKRVVIPPGDRVIVDCGVKVLIPSGYYGRIAPRFMLAITHGVDVVGGVIDENYHGSVRVVVFNHSYEDVEFLVGDCVALLIIERIARPVPVECSEEEFNGESRAITGHGAGGR